MNRSKQRGISLIEGLVAVAILAIGVLAMTVLQATLVATSSNAQLRAEAAFYAEQIIGLASSDAANVGCYAFTTPCANGDATTAADAWLAEVQGRLPGANTLPPSVTYTAGTRQFTVVLQWQHPSDDTARNLTMTTVIR